MIYEVFKLNEVSEDCNYESYALSLSVGDLIQTSHSSNIQRVRNEEKEKGIVKFVKNHLDENTTPFFQPFILHYSGKVISNEGTFILDPKPNFETEIELENGEVVNKSFEFEVLDGNGRLNALIQLQQFYIDKIHSLNNELKDENTTEKRQKRIKKQIDDLKIKNKTLKDIKLTIQLYLNLDNSQKASLFNSVNQGETMSKGRLELYKNEKPENELLQDYIVHTTNVDGFKYQISVDKDIVRSSKERSTFIPSVYLLPTLRKAIRQCKEYNLDLNESKENIFKALDNYIMNVPNPKLFRKQHFSLVGSVIKRAFEYEGNLCDFTAKMASFNFDEYPDVSKQQKLLRNEVLNFVFNGATKKVVVESLNEQTDDNDSEKNLQGFVVIDDLNNTEGKAFAFNEIALTNSNQ